MIWNNIYPAEAHQLEQFRKVARKIEEVGPPCFRETSQHFGSTCKPAIVSKGYRSTKSLGNPDIEKLKHWAIEHNITHAALRSLFKILQKFLSNLPRDPRTFLKTTKDVSVLPISGGNFYNFGIKKALEMILKEFNLKDEITFSLQFNIDGLPLHKSTGKQFWPILVRIVSPFISKISTIAVYYGKLKPSSLEFLNKFIKELKDLLSK